LHQRSAARADPGAWNPDPAAGPAAGGRRAPAGPPRSRTPPRTGPAFLQRSTGTARVRPSASGESCMPVRLPSPSRTLLLIAALLSTPAALARQADSVYVRAGRMLDVESGRLLEDHALLAEGGRIVRVAPAAELPPPAGATVHDLSAYTVLPGLMDAHTHLVGDAGKHGYASLGDSLATATLHGAANARTTLRAGFTTVRDLGSPGYADVALRDAIAEGVVEGPRIIAAGPGIGITGGHCGDDNLLPYDR